MYSKIKSHPSAATIYGEQGLRAGWITREELDAIWAAKKEAMQKGGEAGALAVIARRGALPLPAVDASAMRARLKAVLQALSTLPEGLEIHPKLMPFLKARAELLQGRGPVDWATAESLAWGSTTRAARRSTCRSTASRRPARASRSTTACSPKRP
jgi:2-oxoglutarate dehydrogenase E1 component